MSAREVEGLYSSDKNGNHIYLRIFFSALIPFSGHNLKKRFQMKN